ncbi:hypothetical protein SAMN06298216_0668 [Spirosomataceae bacterium TFI 002]|nr:hypothetical protein SAMN06298216_0668 [Spirosomataceae bacterium TFI 002]
MASVKNKQFPYHKYILVSLLYFFIVAILGTLLRSVTYFNIPFEYANIIHAHSHVAFQGWVYTCLFLILTRLYIKKEKLIRGKYILQFLLTTLAVFGVLIAFTAQGYGLYSIIFSTLFQALNYWFIYRFFKDTRSKGSSLSLKFIKTGLGFGLLSSLFPFVIGYTSAKGLNGTEFYNSLIYSFMHLQYNAWFLLIVVGLFYELLERLGIKISKRQGEIFFWCISIAVIPAISLSLLGMSFANLLQIPAWFSVVMQSIGLVFFIKSLQTQKWYRPNGKEFWQRLFVVLFIATFTLKTGLQSLSIIPYFSDYAFLNKFIFLAYLHLSLLGVVSFSLISMAIHFKWISTDFLSKIGFGLLLLGFIITETILATGGLGIFYSTELLLFGSASMAMGIFFLILNIVISRPEENNISSTPLKVIK